MTRTWTLIVALALLWGSVCAGQQGYADMAPGGLSLTGLIPTGDFAGLSMVPSGDGSSLTGTLEGVQGTLATFEQCTVETGLPEDLFPYWSGLPEFSQIESGMGLQSPELMIGSFSIGEGLPGFTTQFGSLTLPVSGLTTDGTFQMPDFASLIANQ